jgi:Flp pilus assembly protein CpaB
MKRNILPLLAIAFVVAIISTGVFYGLFAGKLKSSSTELPGQPVVIAARNLEKGVVLELKDLRVSEVRGRFKGAFSKPEDVAGSTVLETIQQNEPIMEDRVASHDLKVSKAAGQIPAGFRAVSLRVSESSGVVSLLRPGAKVDVQAVLDRNNSAELKTIVQNVEVLSVNPQTEPATGNRPPGVIVTVLALAQDSDLMALADSGARIRFALRNPLDDANSPRRSMALTSVFQGGTVTEPVRPNFGLVSPASVGSQLTPIAHPIQLRVQAFSVSAFALGELDARSSAASREGSLQIASFRADADATEIIRSLEQRQEAEVVSSWTLDAGLGRPTSLRAGTSPNQLRVQFAPETDALGTTTVKVRPEISLRSGEGVETRKYEADVSSAGSFLVTGWLSRKDHAALDQLFPGHVWKGRDLVILVTSHGPNAIAAANRGR